METRRLKNIAILILLLLNLFLALLLAYHHLQSLQTNEDAVYQLSELFSSDQLILSEELNLSQPALEPMILSRNVETEADMAAMLLGEIDQSSSLGGGIYSYTSPSGAIQFRSGGGFDGTGLSIPVASPEAFSQEFFQSFDYIQTSEQLNHGSGTISALQYSTGAPIIGCSVTLKFENNLLVAVSGSHITVENAVQDAAKEPLDCLTALVRFLDHRRSAGLICRQIDDIYCIYQLNSSSSPLRLTPLWQVDTDTYTCYVDCTTGEVFR